MSRTARTIIVDLLTSTVGNVLVKLQPKKAQRLAENGITLGLHHLSSTERLMRRTILKRMEHHKDYDSLAQLHQNYWEKQGAEFFETTSASFEENFLPDCSFIFELLKEQCTKTPKKFTTLVEIGTGNGAVLNYLNTQFPEIDRFVGIDLSPVQITKNKETFATNQKLDFVAADGLDWIQQHGTAHTIFVTSRGVLEYFTEERLQAFLNIINALGKTIFVAIEPNGTDHDFNRNPNTQPYGPERSFSHNYPKLFQEAQFTLWHLSEKPLNASTKLCFIGAMN